jgi:hypothetical protein
MIKKTKLKGMDSIRTMSGSVTETSHPHRKFLKLAILAMEQARRGKEKASAERRIDNIDNRLAEIEVESKILLQVCNDVSNVEIDNITATQKKDSSSQIKRGFTLKY